MQAMNTAMHRSLGIALRALATAVLVWATPGHCTPQPFWQSWMELGAGRSTDLTLMLLTALFWVVTHVWVLLVVWAESRVTRSGRAGTEPEKEHA
jgi:uncharacterized membrane protein